MKLRTVDRKIWRKDILFAYLQKCANAGTSAVIDFDLEGSCAEALGLYRLLDEFCARENYPKNSITIKTANMVEHHAEYNIVREPDYWYEIKEIKSWLLHNPICIKNDITHYFANFSSRSNWFRLWVATILNSRYSDKTLQTYHYDPNSENLNYNGYIGVDDLFKYKCDLINEAVEFLKSCPRTIDIEYLKNLNNCKNSVYQHENSYYPIQHPSNLNLLQYYKNIFVDIVVEPNIAGNSFLVTEKLWRTIIARRPFIVISNRNYLNNLRKLGFQTFNEFWDEGYDEYEGSQRIIEFEKVLEILAVLPLHSLDNKLKEMQHILDHNFKTFINLTPSKIYSAFS